MQTTTTTTAIKNSTTTTTTTTTSGSSASYLSVRETARVEDCGTGSVDTGHLHYDHRTTNNKITIITIDTKPTGERVVCQLPVWWGRQLG